MDQGAFRRQDPRHVLVSILGAVWFSAAHLEMIRAFFPDQAPAQVVTERRAAVADLLCRAILA